MNNDEKYDLIFNSLLNGTVEDWERLARQFPDFPDGLDGIELTEEAKNDFTQKHSDIYALQKELLQQYTDLSNCIADHWLNIAISEASLECVRWMLSKGVNLNYKSPGGYFPLHCCIDREFPDKYEMLQLLIDNGADVNLGTELAAMAINAWSPLHAAAAWNDLEAIKILLDNGADPALKTIIDDCCTAEQEAAILGNHEAAELIRTYKSKAK
jgi:hypothetical protein